MPMIFFLLLLLGVFAPAESANVCTYEGGWALRVKASTCPINAPVNCGVGIQLRCCPNGLTCAGEGDYGGNWCCKEGEDCRQESSASPKCPDPTWTLWGGNGTLKDGGWCCEPGSNGFYRGNMEAVGCTAAGVRTLPTSLSFASTVATVACVSPTPWSSTSTPTSASSTPTAPSAAESNDSSSSLSGGAIAGIVVGAICGVGLIAGLVGVVMYRKRRRNNKNQGGAAAAAGQAPPPSDMAQKGWSEHHQGGLSHGSGAGGGLHSPYQHNTDKLSAAEGYGAQGNAWELNGARSPTELPDDRSPQEMGNGRAPPSGCHEIA